jgi:DNA-binding MarR family transcriptional regulator
MPVKFKFDNRLLELWMVFHQTYNSVFKCEDKEFAKAGITTQQHVILMAIKNGGETTTPSQLADWLDRNANSITLIIDRMERSGLVKRVRDVADRRSLRIAMTEKGEKTLRKSTKIGWEIIQKLLSQLSEKEVQAFVKQLETLREKAVAECYPDKEIELIDVAKAKSLSKVIDKTVA